MYDIRYYFTIVINYFRYFVYYWFFNNTMYTIGVTGTNGKTTTTFIIQQMLKDTQYGYCGLIGTEFVDTKKEMNKSKLTTPSLSNICHIFKQMIKNGCNSVAMEVSSQGYHQGRTLLVDYNCCIMTNVTQDHLDYHKTFDEYLNVKTNILKSAKDFTILNEDDPNISYIKNMIKNKTITYGFSKNADVRITSCKYHSNGINFTISYNDIQYDLSTNLVGRFNLYNCIAALSFLLYHNMELDKEKLKNLKPPPGRVEKIKNVIIDYAHTPDALKNIIDYAKQIDNIGKIVILAGATGDRDKMKRPIMGKEMSRADVVVVTTDDPMNEDPQSIIDEVMNGVTNENAHPIVDRKKAIEYGMSIIDDNDILIVAGKGNEDRMIMKNKTIHFSDREIIQNILKVCS